MAQVQEYLDLLIVILELIKLIISLWRGTQ
ncbi:hypothetical protein C4K35_4756 [Pseudomonas chlororaphis subsp. piscium]|nr:hypothetical protein C4K35_4756 [Pseudomonas chlororaphis subsp. piscium]